MATKKTEPVVNLLDLKAGRALEWEQTEEGLVSLLVPRFRHPFMVKHVMPRLKSRTIKVKLDKLGSFVWRSCDGVKTVGEVAEGLRESFGEAAEPAYERVATFIKRLKREKFIELAEAPEEG